MWPVFNGADLLVLRCIRISRHVPTHFYLHTAAVRRRTKQNPPMAPIARSDKDAGSGVALVAVTAASELSGAKSEITASVPVADDPARGSPCSWPARNPSRRQIAERDGRAQHVSRNCNVADINRRSIGEVADRAGSRWINDEHGIEGHARRYVGKTGSASASINAPHINRTRSRADRSILRAREAKA
jgi:hypothetical protein